MSAPLGSLERALRITAAVLALSVALLANVRAYAEPPERLRWERVAIVEEVAITVHTVSVEELANLTHTKQWDMRNVRQTHRHGLAKLYRNRATGAWTCHVYVTRDVTEATLEHERRHCRGWVHP